MASGGVDHFKAEFKRYKQRLQALDLSDVLDTAQPETLSASAEHELIELAGCRVEAGEGECAKLGLRPPSQWKVYGVKSVSGLVLIPDPFLHGCQHYWVARCLKDYPCLPNVCNLDAHMKRAGHGEVWTEASGEGQKTSKSDLLRRLRWVTLGYHYDWGSKTYSAEHRSPFPGDLAALSRLILKEVGFQRFTAEAAIVNYYHLASTLAGHTDHSELDLSIPLLSISFGQSAIFLIGGPSRDVTPQALLLHTGDVLILSRESRLAVHGVPRILAPPSHSTAVPAALSAQALKEGAGHWSGGRHVSTDSQPTSGQDPAAIPEDHTPFLRPSVWAWLTNIWPQVEVYLADSRINVNVRQVAPEGHVLQQ